MKLLLKSSRAWFTAGSAAVLLFATGWTIFGENRPALLRHGTSLSALMPMADVGSWRGEMLPVAESAKMESATWNVLRYDDVAHARFIDGPNRITVFCAYWKPASMSYRSVAGHSPEVCWPGMGWECSRKELVDLVVPGVPGNFASTRSQAYQKDGVTENVLFWHVVDGKAYLPGPASDVPGRTFIPDLVRLGPRQRCEQYVIRIASNLSPSELVRSEVVRELLRSFDARGVMKTR